MVYLGILILIRKFEKVTKWLIIILHYIIRFVIGNIWRRRCSFGRKILIFYYNFFDTDYYDLVMF